MPNARHLLKYAQEARSFAFDHAALTASVTVKRFKAPANRAFRLERVVYVNPTGLVGDNTNAFSAAVINTTGSVVMATVFNTDLNDTPAGASLAANTFVEGVISAATACILAAGQELAVLFTLDGTQTLPAGTFYFEGRLL